MVDHSFSRLLPYLVFVLVLTIMWSLVFTVIFTMILLYGSVTLREPNMLVLVAELVSMPVLAMGCLFLLVKLYRLDPGETPSPSLPVEHRKPVPLPVSDTGVTLDDPCVTNAS